MLILSIISNPPRMSISISRKIAGMDINALAQYAAAEDKKKKNAWAAKN